MIDEEIRKESGEQFVEKIRSGQWVQLRKSDNEDIREGFNRWLEDMQDCQVVIAFAEFDEQLQEFNAREELCRCRRGKSLEPIRRVEV